MNNVLAYLRDDCADLDFFGLDCVDERVDLLDIVSKFSDKEQRIVRLCLVDDLTNERVGEIMGIPETTVRDMRRRVILKIRTMRRLQDDK